MHNSRMRLNERAVAYEYGMFSLSDEDLLVTVLEDDVSMRNAALQITRQIGLGGLARELVNCPGGLQRFGLSWRQVAHLKWAYELMSRCNLADYITQTQIWTADDAAVLFQAQMSHFDHEELHVLALDTQHQVVDYATLYKGTVNSFDIRIGEVMGVAIRRNCPALLMAHNHPSGDPHPSPDDLDVTERAVAAARMLDLTLVDHLIIGNPGYVSLKAQMNW
jgi:DNA repair protein RadC